MDLQTIPLDRINPAPYNPRVDLQPGDLAYTKLQNSLDEFGLVEPLVWNKRTGNLVGGHQRLKVIKARGDTETPVVVVDLPIPKEKALNLALNKIQGDWDNLKLAELLNDLIKADDLDFNLTGFEFDEANDLISDLVENVTPEEENFDLDAMLKARSKPITQPGDLILLGTHPSTQHRLLCGDSTNPNDVKTLMTDQRAILFATDPPYLVDYTGTNHPPRKFASEACIAVW